MTDACQLHPTAVTPPTGRSVAALLVGAVAARDFDLLTECLEPTTTMRAMLPRGAVDFNGADEIVGAFRQWFGGAEGFEVLDTTTDDVGGRLHASWRFRVHPTPRGDDRWHVIEQQVYAHAGERITALDLLCSGFVPDDAR